MTIINLTQHKPTQQQIEAGVVEFTSETDIADVKRLLTFTKLVSASDIKMRAQALAVYAVSSGCTTAMIGGAPWLMAPLEKALLDLDIQPVYSFSIRQSVESTDSAGNVVKQSTFSHVGFIPACPQ